MRPATAAAAALLILLLAAPAMAAEDFGYVDAPPSGAVVVDSRPAERCAAASIAGARCLPAEEIVGPHGRLASFRDILWFLGTAGLTGDGHVAVTGDGVARDFLAGVLYLAGQERVSIVRPPPGQRGGTPGALRADTRQAVWQAPMRHHLILLRQDLAAAAPVRLLDGRDEDAYWGARSPAARGGHLPGAESLPALELAAVLARGEELRLPNGLPTVAYAGGAVDGIAYFTLLRAGAGLPARVYPGGWREWAADPTLPVDAATYPQPAAPPPALAAERPAGWRLASAGLGGAALAAGLLLLTLRRTRRWR